ncbi:hypothetical protein HMPREF1869_00626 [Bacteroidales bacterium KA00251]|nr:hypothetical protein HMPREF1869_00626 [Bacteroidales bacterium KA00251]
MGYYITLREEEIKNHVAQDIFADYDCTRIISNIDFAVTDRTQTAPLDPHFENYYLWAEAKRGNNQNLYHALAQLILTIGRNRSKTIDLLLPPKYLGAFDAQRIVFIPYSHIVDIIAMNDFDWTVTPSDHSTKEFGMLLHLIEEILDKELLLFDYETQKKELCCFIKVNFRPDSSDTKCIKINRTNFTHIYQRWREEVMPSISINWQEMKQKGIISADFYLADLLSEKDATLTDKLFVILKNDHYKTNYGISAVYGLSIMSEINFNDKQKAYSQFWNHYERPPKREYWDYMLERRDLLVPQDVRERKGSFFTPQQWVALSQEYLAQQLGDEWQEEYYIWDCCAGTGNLLAGLTNKYNIWASTLDKADVDIMHERIDRMDAEAARLAEAGCSKFGGANLLKSHVFQFDFLNDPFTQLPASLQDVINDLDKRKKLVIYINPPYKEAGNARQKTGTGKNQAGVTNTSLVYQNYRVEVGSAFNELYAQFFIRIYKEIKGCILAEFSKLKLLQGANSAKFRSVFRAKLEKLFIVPADTFDNVKGEFPIGFFIWDTSQETTFEEIRADVYHRDSSYQGVKTILSCDDKKRITPWMSSFNKPAPHSSTKKLSIGMIESGRNDFQHQALVRIENHMTSERTHAALLDIHQETLIVASIFLAVRHCIERTWLNDRDQFLYPHDTWQEDYEFQTDCLAYTLFHTQNRITTAEGTNHWIPFTEEEVEAKERFKSHFMTDFIRGRLLADGSSTLFGEEEVPRHPYPTGGTPITFSPEAQHLFEAGCKLWHYYHTMPDANPNASYYDIRDYFQGRNARGEMNSSSEDAQYTLLVNNLREAVTYLGDHKIAPKVYKHGFLLGVLPRVQGY